MTGLFGGSKRFRRHLEERWHDLYRLAYSWCHDGHLASDLVQETLVKALKSGAQLKKETSVDTWLFTILSNAWKDHCRKEKDTVDIDDVNLNSEENPEGDHSRSQLINRVRGAIGGLRSEQRQIITMVDLQGLTYAEVSQILEVPVGTVMSRLCRARQALRSKLRNIESGLGQVPHLWRVK